MAKRAFDRTDIELLLALSQSGSLAACARALGVHHATAFRRLEDMEAKIGVRLFERLASGYRLTPAGNTLVAPAGRIRDELRDFDALVLNHDKALAGTVRVTSSDGLGLGYIPALLGRFRERYPGIQVELLVQNELSDLAAREVDVAIRPAKRLTGSMVGRKAATMGYALYASPNYLKAMGHPAATRPDLSGHRIIGYDASMAFYSTARWLAQHARRASTPVCCNSLWAMRELARAGAGIAAIPCIIGDADKGIERITAPIESMATTLWLCTHPDIRGVARVRAVLDFLFEAIGQDRHRLAGKT